MAYSGTRNISAYLHATLQQRYKHHCCTDESTCKNMQHKMNTAEILKDMHTEHKNMSERMMVLPVDPSQ